MIKAIGHRRNNYSCTVIRLEYSHAVYTPEQAEALAAKAQELLNKTIIENNLTPVKVKPDRSIKSIRSLTGIKGFRALYVKNLSGWVFHILGKNDKGTYSKSISTIRKGFKEGFVEACNYYMENNPDIKLDIEELFVKVKKQCMDHINQ